MSKKSDCGNILPSCLNPPRPFIDGDIKRSQVARQNLFLCASNRYGLIAGYFNMLQAQEKITGCVST